MELIHPLAEIYASTYSTQEDEMLKQIAAETYSSHVDPQMMSGHLQGQFLEIISKLIRPIRILEIGTMVGYSTICLAKGLQQGGMLHTIELREQDAAIAKQNFEKANLSHCIKIHTGNALEIIPTLLSDWDLVFLDADKTGYSKYYELVKPRLKKGALIVADNVLFHGEVLNAEIKGKNAKAIQAFNELVAADETVEKILLTQRDGLFLIRKK